MWNLEEAISYNKKQGAPSDQSALVSLLREVQQENGGAIHKSALPAMAEDTKDEAVFDLLLIGTDATTEEETGRSDAMVLLRLDAGAGEIRVVSFLRDLYVRIPGHGRNRLNAAYAFGDAELLLATLEENFGVTADAYAEVNFARLTKVIDRIGGVEAEVSEAERRQLNGILRHYNRAIGVQEADGHPLRIFGGTNLCALSRG